MPAEQAIVSPSRGPNVTTSAVQKVIDTSALKPLSETQRQAFKVAANVLRLNAHDAGEREYEYADALTWDDRVAGINTKMSLWKNNKHP